MSLEFSDKDIKMGTVVDPGWYRMVIEEAGGEKASKDGGSINYLITGVILFDGDTGSQTFAGVPVNWNFNSKAPGFAKGFIEIIAGVPAEAGKKYELAGAKGQQIDVFVDNKLYEGRKVNNVTHKYRQPKPDVMPV